MAILKNYNPVIHDVYIFDPPAEFKLPLTLGIPQSSIDGIPIGYSETCRAIEAGVDFSGIGIRYRSFKARGVFQDQSALTIQIDPTNINFYNTNSGAVVLISPRHALACAHYFQWNGLQNLIDRQIGFLGKSGQMYYKRITKVYWDTAPQSPHLWTGSPGPGDQLLFEFGPNLPNGGGTQEAFDGNDVKIYNKFLNWSSLTHPETLWVFENQGRSYKVFTAANEFGSYVDSVPPPDELGAGINGVVPVHSGDSGSPVFKIADDGECVYAGMREGGRLTWRDNDINIYLTPILRPFGYSVSFSTAEIFPCVGYCYSDPIIPAGSHGGAGIHTLLNARRHIYGIAVEYASYDDIVAIPYEDYGNDSYWIGYHGQNGRFDPFITTPPATVAEAQALDSSGWPHRRFSETSKRVQGLMYILAAKKDASLAKYMKNPERTYIRDWPQPAANFNVDRRPVSAIPDSVSGGDPAAKYLNFVNGVSIFTKNTGINKLIQDHLDWNYNRGVRRFMLWLPCGYLSADGGAYTSAVSSAMKNRVYTGGIINPAESCWSGITVKDPTTNLFIPQTVAQANSATFNPNGRLDEWLDKFGDWITAHPLADVGIYIGYVIPTVDGIPNASTHIAMVGGAGATGDQQNTTTGRGWQIPDPANNAAHAAFLERELQPWIDIGITSIGLDVGQGMFNYAYGGTISYGDGTASASKSPVGDYKHWLMTRWPTLKTVIGEALPIDFKAPVLNEFNQIADTSYPRKTVYLTDTSMEVCKAEPTLNGSSLDSINPIYTDSCWANKGRERFRKLNPDGKDYRTQTDPNGLVYSAGAYQYCPYVILQSGNLNSGEWNIGKHNMGTISNWAGLDPNNMWCWYKRNTEIGLYVENYYVLSPTLRSVYRQYFPVGPGAVQDYGNIWQLTPAWHDRGIAQPTPAIGPLQLLGPYDGRQHVRDSAFYNKVRNEIFVNIKNFIERGYVFWAGVSKNDLQLVKDVHADVLEYVAGFEVIDTLDPLDVITENRSLPVYEIESKSTAFRATKPIKDATITQILLDTSVNTDQST